MRFQLLYSTSVKLAVVWYFAPHRMIITLMTTIVRSTRLLEATRLKTVIDILIQSPIITIKYRETTVTVSIIMINNIYESSKLIRDY